MDALKMESEPKTETKPKAETKPKTEAKARAETRPKTERAGIWVYIGPNLKGLAQSGTVFRGGREDALAALADAVQAVPEVKTLLVSGGALGAARQKIRTPGNALFEAFRRAKKGGKA